MTVSRHGDVLYRFNLTVLIACLNLSQRRISLSRVSITVIKSSPRDVLVLYNNSLRTYILLSRRKCNIVEIVKIQNAVM
jgi:hypothetical protein